MRGDGRAISAFMSDPFDLPDGPVAASPHVEPVGQPAPAPARPYLETLNESQRDAVEYLDGPLLVLAGAGTGKTRVLTTRLAHLLMTGKAKPWEILAVTFTNKAAFEMRERVAGLLGRPVEGWWVGTFHAIGARVLRSRAESVNRTPNFTILDADDQARLMKQHLEARGIDEKRCPPRVAAGVIQRWKDRGWTPDRVPDAEAAALADGEGRDLYQDYQNRLEALNAADFGDLLMLCVELFQKDPEALAHYQSKFRYIMVDEYQDTNVAQYLWLRLLAQSHRNICCVGDDDQSIYSWRGAEVGNILRFEQDFPGTGIVRLERNYRSTPHILGAASGLIANNEGRLGKTLWTDEGEGEKVVVQGVWDGEEEARVVGDEIEALQSKGSKLNEIAVLVRASFQTREFEERLITLGLPYRVIGGPKFYERREVRDAIAYFRLILQPADDLAFERIINVPSRKLGDASLRAVHRHARAGGLSLERAAAELLDTDELRPQARRSFAQFLENVRRWRGEADRLEHTELAGIVLEESGYIDMLKADKSIEAPGRLDNLKEMVEAMGDFENLAGFLEHVSLVMDNEDSGGDDKVSLMTLHGAKGLEFETVFLPGWEEDLFPHQRALDDGGVSGLEEERRLAYVGVTRARKRARITFAANRRVYGHWRAAIPSRFIDELPAEHLSRRRESGLYGGLHDGGLTMDDFHGAGRRGAARRTLGPGGAGTRAEAREAAANLTAGVRVFHQKFGYGAIVAVDGDKLEIDFEKAGQKRVMASFVEVHG